MVSSLEDSEIEADLDRPQGVLSPYVGNPSEFTGTDSQEPQPISTDLAQECHDLTSEFSTNEVFVSCTEAIQWCHNKARGANTVVIIKKSQKKPKVQGSFIVMACERFDKYKIVNRTCSGQDAVARHHRKNPRKTGTKKCRLNPEEKDLCISLLVNGVKPASILSTMKSRDSRNVSTSRTIYNVKSKFRVKVMEGRTKMQKLLELLDVHRYVTSNRRETDSERALELFWSHPDGSRLAQCFPTVLLLDCTYKTNRWCMPLFHAVGVTSTSKSFTIAYCFMSAEKTENYIWAPQRLRQLYSANNLPAVIVTDDDYQLQTAVNLIFPAATRLLCTYHISYNVTSHFEKDIPSNKEEDLEDIKKDWEILWRSADHAMYEINLAYFLKTWSMLYPTAVSYLRTQWLARKEEFVYAWTNNIPHFGNTTTNRAESEHATLKNFLKCSTGDFLKCWQDMDNQWVTRVINIQASLEKSKTIAVHAYSHSPVTKRLVYNIYHAALQLITVEVSSLSKSRFGGRCLCILRKTYGLPCACEILNCHKNCSHISLDSIHEHWKHLSMDPVHEKVAAVFDWENLFEKIRMKYEACTELQKHFMLEMLIEIADPSKTTMQEPKGKFVTRGFPTNAQTKAQKKKDESTKRDLSEWERQRSRMASTSASKKVPFKAKKKAPVKYHMTEEVKIIDLSDLNALPNLNDMDEEDVFPSKVVLKRKKVHCPIKAPKQRRKYTKMNKINSQAMSYDDEYLQKLIQGITFHNPKILSDVVERLENVAPDGHCGFRACAEMLGLSADDGWKTVKFEMERELTVNSEMYIPIIGGVE